MRIVLALVLLASPAAAQTWDMRVAGVPVGVATLDVRMDGGGYRIDGTARTVGPVRALGRYDYAGRAFGTAQGGTLTPARYEEVERDDGEERRSVLTLGRSPSAQVSDDDALPPAQLRGALDPLTALSRVLGDRPAQGACDLSLRFTDGVRLAQIDWRPTNDPATCAGTWRRLAGPPPSGGRERRREAPFRVSLRPIEGGWRVAEISADAPIGRFRLTRR